MQDNYEVLCTELTVQKKRGVDCTDVTLKLIKYKQALKGTHATGNVHTRRKKYYGDSE
jgi:hypothetical protein